MEIFKYFSKSLREILLENIPIEKYESIEEIRLRNEKKIYIKLKNGYIVIDNIVTTQQMLETLQLLTENSLYSYQNEICNAYITIPGGHRIGITGNVSYEGGKVLNINYIYSLNFRIARQINGCSSDIIKYIYNGCFNIYNTLIVGGPGTGKTTLLKDIIRNIATNKMNIVNISVVDERGEISAMYKGMLQNDLGDTVDVLENIPKTVRNKNDDTFYGT